MPRQPLLQRLKRFYFVFILISFFVLPGLAYAQWEIVKDLYTRAIEAYQHQHYQEAMDFYGQIIKMVPSFAPAYNGLALANQAALGDEDRTIQYLKTAISYDPRLAQAYDNLGRIYYSHGDVDQAQGYFEKALQIDPQFTSSQLSLAWINLLARSKPETASRYFLQVLKVSQDPKIYYGLGQAYFASNKRTEAMEMITKLRSLSQDELAERLENSLRDNPQVNDQDNNTKTQVQGATPGQLILPKTPDTPTGIKVHLKGKL